MSEVKEFKPWFFRIAHQPTGFKQDQEVGFPITRILEGVARRQRLHKNDFPSEAMYRKLLASALFSLEWEDRAKDSNDANYLQNGNVLGGHVTVATDSQAIGGESDLGVPFMVRDEIGKNGDESRYTRVPRTSQLPTHNEKPNTGIDAFFLCDVPATIPVPIIVNPDPSIITRNHYLSEINPEFRLWITTLVEALRVYLSELNVTAATFGAWSGTAGVTYNESVNGEVVVGEDPGDCREYKTFEIGVDIKDITLVDGVVTGTIGMTPVTGTTTWVEVSPRNWKLNVNIIA